MTHTNTDPADVTNHLRWARGMHTTEAATELLIRAVIGTLATTARPWIKPTHHGHWIEFGVLAGLAPVGKLRVLDVLAWRTGRTGT